MEDKLVNLLENKLGYSEVDFDYKDDESETYYLEGYSDAFVTIRLEVEEKSFRLYDAYIGDKHHTYMGTYDLLTGEQID